jgi:ubiquitin C-terminal hydrolase
MSKLMCFGVPNVGNTCYLSSAVTVLSGTQLFDRCIPLSKFITNDSAAAVVRVVSSLRTGIAVTFDQVKDMVKSLVRAKCIEGGTGQQDASEALVKIMDLLSNGSADHYGSKWTRTRTDGKTPTVVIAVEKDVVDSVLVLSLGKDKKKSVQSLLNNYMKPETVEDGTVRTSAMTLAPRVLVLIVSRGDVSSRRNHDAVTVDEKIMIGTVGFELRAVCLHLSTTSQGGHWVSAVRAASIGKWFEYNDSAPIIPMDETTYLKTPRVCQGVSVLVYEPV